MGSRHEIPVEKIDLGALLKARMERIKKAKAEYKQQIAYVTFAEQRRRVQLNWEQIRG